MPRPRLLERALVVSEARRIAASQGVQALTMRRLADALGVMPNALYTYFPDKAAILDAVLDNVVGDVSRPRSGRSWRQGVMSLMTSYRRVLLEQPGLIGLTLSRPMMGPNALRLREDLLALLRQGGLRDTDAVGAFLAVFAYTTGFVSFEAGRAPSAREERQRAEGRRIHEGLPAEAFPTTRALAKRLAKRPGDSEFRRGLQGLLVGFAAR